MVFVLIIAGGLVTSTGSGLSVPDWPLSYGKFFPPMVGGVRFEHSHRLIAGLVGFLTLGFTIMILKHDQRKWMKYYGIAMLVSVIFQAILGGLTVKYLLPTPISVFHACLGQTFLGLSILACFFTSREWNEVERNTLPLNLPIKPLAAVLSGLIFTQLLLGAVIRHTERQIGVEYHIALAILIVVAIFLNCRTLLENENLKQMFFLHGASLLIFVLLQAGLGLASLSIVQTRELADSMNAWPIIIRTAHQANGAVILSLSLLLTARVFRFLR